MRCSYRQQLGTCRRISKDRSNICIQLSKEDQAFYMRDNDEDGGETVNPIDLLVPGVGEIVGESQRVRFQRPARRAPKSQRPCNVRNGEIREIFVAS
ncbi:hypothetical protein ACHAXN_004958 [Cyclotella atomus]